MAPTPPLVAAAPPIFIDAGTLHSLLLTPKTLIRHLQTSLPAASTATRSPLRHSHQASAATSLLLMPSWSLSPSLPYTGVKLVTHHPLHSPSIHATYVLFHSLTGRTLAALDFLDTKAVFGSGFVEGFVK